MYIRHLKYENEVDHKVLGLWVFNKSNSTISQLYQRDI